MDLSAWPSIGNPATAKIRPALMQEDTGLVLHRVIEPPPFCSLLPDVANTGKEWKKQPGIVDRVE